MFDRVYTKFNEEITFHVDDNIFNVHAANYAYQFNTKKIGRGEVYFIDCNNNKLVLKEYNRGGLIRYITKNKYLISLSITFYQELKLPQYPFQILLHSK